MSTDAPPPQADEPASSYRPAPTTSTLAVASATTGILGLVGTWLFGVGVLLSFVAIVTGILGRRSIRRSGGTRQGNGLALTGLVTGALAVVILGVILALYATGVLHYRVRTA